LSSQPEIAKEFLVLRLWIAPRLMSGSFSASRETEDAADWEAVMLYTQEIP
jgi:hypothetical protein